MPDIIFPNRESLPEELRAFAKDVEGGNGVVVNLVANDKLKEFRENNIKVSKERDDLNAIVTQVRTIFPDFEPSTVSKELEELRATQKRVKDGQLTESKAIEEALSERTKQMKQQYETDLATRAREAKDARDRAAILDQRIRQQAVKQAVLGVVMDEKSGVAPSAVDDIVARAYGVFHVENDGERIVPKIGDSILYGPDGTTAMSPAEWVQSLKDKSPHLFRQSSGGGGTGTGGEKRFGGFSAQEFQKLSPEEKLRIANEQVRPANYR